LLLLSAVIATAGVVSDSTATVIGAMIIAPLMTPDPGGRAGCGAGRPGQTWAGACCCSPRVRPPSR
jgi:hypothetical protein